MVKLNKSMKLLLVATAALLAIAFILCIVGIVLTVAA